MRARLASVGACRGRRSCASGDGRTESPMQGSRRGTLFRPPPKGRFAMSRASRPRSRSCAAVARLGAVLVVMAAALASANVASAGRGTPDAKLLHSYQPCSCSTGRGSSGRPRCSRSSRTRSSNGSSGTSPAPAAPRPFWTVVDPDPDPGELPGPTGRLLPAQPVERGRRRTALAGRDAYAAAWRLRQRRRSLRAHRAHADSASSSVLALLLRQSAPAAADAVRTFA